MKKTLLLATTAILLSSTANAADIKPYIGFDLGGAYADYSTETNLDEYYTTADLNFGLRFNKYFGLEVFSQASSENSENSIDYSYTAYGIDAMAYLPANTENLDVLLSAGVGNYTVHAKTESGDYDYDISKDETSFRLGLGLMYSFNDNWAMRGMFHYIPVDFDYFGYDVLDSISEFTLGVRYSF